MIDVLDAPLPFLIGIEADVLKEVRTSALDKGHLVAIYNEKKWRWCQNYTFTYEASPRYRTVCPSGTGQWKLDLQPEGRW